MEEYNKPMPMKKYKMVRRSTLIIAIVLSMIVTALVSGMIIWKVFSNHFYSNSKLNKFLYTYDLLTEDYYTKVNDEKLIDGAINGMLTSLDDPYSSYMTSEQAQQFHTQVSGDFVGIGVQVERHNNQLTVVSPLEDSPAQEAGILAGDIIVKADGKVLKDLEITEATSLIKGAEGTKVKLTIQRGDKTFDITVPRQKITEQSVKYELLDNHIAHITITAFQDNTAEQLQASLEKIPQDHVEKLILDVRDNPGGLLDSAYTIANEFIDNDKVIYQVENRKGEKDIVKATGSINAALKNVQTIVLMNEGSASASEILAGALKESANIKLIGTKSFGKGTVQTTVDYADDSLIKYTIRKWLTPAGHWIHKEGIQPDIKVELPDYAKVPVFDTTTTYEVGQQNEAIKSIKTILHYLDMYSGNIDDKFDDELLVSINKFQDMQKIEKTKQLNEATSIEIIRAFSKKLKENDVQLKAAIEYFNK